MELTILMPCLDEALTVETCVAKARAYLQRRNIAGEVLVADNGSVDGSQAKAQAAGARVIQVRQRGYGAALLGGINAAAGRFVIMADADNSYDFADLDAFVDSLRIGTQLVVGNRFKGEIKTGAMPLLNRYLGNPILSFIGRSLFPTSIGDFHCGLRGFDRSAILKLGLRCSGMEFASEMVVKASLARLSIEEVPTTLSPDGRQRGPHLRRWRDGWRHLRFMLLRSPQWLFLYPGLCLTVTGTVGAIILARAPMHVDGVFTLDINALLFFAVAAIVGVQFVLFGLFALSLARKLRLGIVTGIAQGLLSATSQKVAVGCGAVMALLGIGGVVFTILRWRDLFYGPLVPSDMMRLTIPSVAVLAIGTQLLFGGFLLGFVEME